MKPDFKQIDIKKACFGTTEGVQSNEADWNTPEHIRVMPVYTKQNLCAHRGINVIEYSVCAVSERQSWSPNTHPTLCCKWQIYRCVLRSSLVILFYSLRSLHYKTGFRNLKGNIVTCGVTRGM